MISPACPTGARSTSTPRHNSPSRLLPRCCSRIHAELAAPFALGDIMIATDVSIGLALAPEHGREVSVLLRRADIAMYKAKRARSKNHVYAATDESNGDDRLRPLQELRTALLSDQFILHFQPKLDLGTGDICGVEALVRWDHPRRGLVYPDGFLPLVEEGGMMRALTAPVLTQAVDQAAQWAAAGSPMADDARAAALVASTIGLAHSLGLRMVAEGVENDTALTELGRHRCDQAQGFHIGRPMPAAVLDHWLAARTRHDPARTWTSR